MSNKKNYEILNQYDFIDEEFIHGVSDKYAPLIGSFFILFSSLEHTLNLSIAEAVSQRSHEIGYAMIEKLGIKNKIDLFSGFYLRLTLSINKRKKTELTKIVKMLHDLNTFRNILAHANWYSISREGRIRSKIVVDKEEGYVKFKLNTIQPKMIKANIKNIELLDGAIQNFVGEVFNQT